MASRKIRRKYQSGGVIPSFQGMQSLSRPQQINQGVRPIEYDPSGALRAVDLKNRSLQTAIRHGDLNRLERQLIWQKETDERDFLQGRIDTFNNTIARGLDKLTSLDLNQPDQYKMAQNMRSKLQEINTRGVEVLTDQSNIKPADRLARLQENVAEATALFTDPNYVRTLQTNDIVKTYYDQLNKDLSDPNVIVDFRTATDNLANADDLRARRINHNDFLSKLRNHGIDKSLGKLREDKVYEMLSDSFKKGRGTWEKYSGDDKALVFMERVRIGSEEEQAQAVYDFLMADETWKRLQEGSGRFIDEQSGTLDHKKVWDHAMNTVRFWRNQHGIGEDAAELNTDLRVIKMNQDRSSGSGSGGTRRTPTAIENERKINTVIKGLEDRGYQVNDPTIIKPDDVITDLIDTIEMDDEEFLRSIGAIGEADRATALRYKRQLEGAITLRGGGDGSGVFLPNSERRKAVLRRVFPDIDFPFDESISGDKINQNRLEAADNALAIPPDFERLINEEESRGDYDALYNFANRQGSPFEDIKVSQMTIGELKEFTDPKGPYGRYVLGLLKQQDPTRNITSTPLGKYQIVGTKLRESADELGLLDSMIFSPEVQDMIAAHLFGKRVASKDTTAGKRQALRNEWEGFEYVPDNQLDTMIEDFEERKKSLGTLSEMAQDTTGNPRANVPNLDLEVDGNRGGKGFGIGFGAPLFGNKKTGSDSNVKSKKSDFQKFKRNGG